MSRLEEGETPHGAAVATDEAVHDRKVLMARLLITCVLLIGPTTIIIALIFYAMFRSEETHPWSHRSVACSAPREISRAPTG